MSLDNSKIVFVRFGDNIGVPKGMFTVNPDGTGLTRIRETGDAPAWSPDGRWIAFYDSTGSDTAPSAIFVMRPDGASCRNLTGKIPGAAACPMWSPDSRSIVFCVWKDSLHQIWTVNRDGSHLREITRAGENGYPVWTPSGEIAFIRSSISDGRKEIWLMAPDGSGMRKCDLFQEGDKEPTWSRDGSRIACVRDGDICLIDPQNGQSRIIELGAGVVEIAWAPDNLRLAFTARLREEAGGEVFVLNVDSLNVHRVSESPLGPRDKSVESWDVHWSPNLQSQASPAGKGCTMFVLVILAIGILGLWSIL